MNLQRRHFLHLAAGAAAIPAVSRVGWAQAYPSRPVRVIVPAAAGGGIDITARLIGQWLSERFGQQFIVEDRGGAGTTIGTEMVVHAPPDGYTLLLASLGNAAPRSPFCSTAPSRLRASQNLCNGGNHKTNRLDRETLLSTSILPWNCSRVAPHGCV
jgi:tripartite-type tricarboxylate transporter receptor subunit TctC